MTRLFRHFGNLQVDRHNSDRQNSAGRAMSDHHDRALSQSASASFSLLRASQHLHLWHGASGQAYQHKIYSLINCPEIGRVNYVLVRNCSGEPSALRIGVTQSAYPSLNLAFLRWKAAQLGANEVHIFPMASDEDERRLIETDLQAALFGQFTSDAPSAKTALYGDRAKMQDKHPQALCS